MPEKTGKMFTKFEITLDDKELGIYGLNFERGEGKDYRYEGDNHGLVKMIEDDILKDENLLDKYLDLDTHDSLEDELNDLMKVRQAIIQLIFA